MADAKEDLPEFIVKKKVYTTKFQVIAYIVFILGGGSSGFFFVIGIPYLIYLYNNLREAYFEVREEYNCIGCEKKVEVLKGRRPNDNNGPHFHVWKKIRSNIYRELIEIDHVEKD